MSEAVKLPTFDELYRQLRALPPNRNGEIVGGELITSPRPGVPHANIGIELAGELRIRSRRKKGGSGPPSGWWILGEPELHLNVRGQTQVLSPDIAGWKRERVPMLPDGACVSLTPDWICEVLSPSTESYDRKAKARLYLEAGVTWHWLVSPRARTVEAYRREGAFWMQLGVWTDEDVVAIEPFPEFELDLSYWWDGLEREESKDY